MKALILAAGYGTRLYPLTLNKSKALLEVGGKTILERILEKVLKLPYCDAIYIVTNDKFYDDISDWVKKKSFKEGITVLNDSTSSNDDRLGAIGDINFVLEETTLSDGLLIVGSDNLFDFELREFVDFARLHKGNVSVALYDIKDIKKAGLYGIAVLREEDNEIIAFEEKPENPSSTLAATCIYFYPKEKFYLIKEYMKSNMSKDAPGNFIKWLKGKNQVYGYVVKDNWYDIGDKETLKRLDEEFRRKENLK